MIIRQYRRGMAVIPILLIVIISILWLRPVTSESSGNNWPIARADRGLSGYTDNRLPESPVLLWSYVNDQRADGSPVVRDGVAYFCDRKGNIRGIGANGESVFHYPLNKTVEATGTIVDSIYYIGANDGVVSAVSLTQSDTVWTFETFGQVSGAPNWIDIDGKRNIAFGSYDYYMYCVDIATGVERNKFESGYYINGSMAHWNQYVLFGGCDALVRMVDLALGAVVDSFQATTYIPASPTIRDNRAYVADYGGNLYELTLEEGGIKESRQLITSTQEQGSMLSAPACSNDYIVVLDSESYLTTLDRNSGEEKWRIKLTGKSGESSPIISGKKVIACTKEGQLAIIDLTDGSILWQYDVGETIVATPAVIDKRFYILTSKGRLLCFGEKEG